MIRLSTIILLSLTLWLTGCAGFNTWSSNDPGVTRQAKSQANKNKRAERARAANLSTQDFSKIQDPSNDLWQRVRDGFEIPDPPDNALTIKHVNQLASNPVYVNRLLQRSSYYLFYIEEEVEARDMPSELALLPFVESAFNPKAVSPAKAAGMWQFMPATGKDYKLTQNTFRDERRDIIQSTRAALDYLQRLYGMFGDWHLALAAYNWGEGSVAKAIKRNQMAGLPTDYFSLQMPNETRNYVPKLLAYKRIIEYPQSYGFRLPPVEDHPFFLAVSTPSDIDVDLVITLADISQDQFISLNPSFTKPVILKAANPQILLPFGKAEIFQDNLKKYKGPLSSWTAVVVDRTDTVDKVAANLNVDPNQLRDLNGIPKGMRIRSGSTVLVPKTTLASGDIPSHLADGGLLSLEKEFTPVVMKCRGSKCTTASVRNAVAAHSGKTTTAHIAETSSSKNKVSSRNDTKKNEKSPKTEGKSAGKSSSSQVKKTASK